MDPIIIVYGLGSTAHSTAGYVVTDQENRLSQTLLTPTQHHTLTHAQLNAAGFPPLTSFSAWPQLWACSSILYANLIDPGGLRCDYSPYTIIWNTPKNVLRAILDFPGVSYSFVVGNDNETGVVVLRVNLYR